MQAQVGAGVRAIRVREHPEMDSVCFFLMRADGSVDDVSVHKCINILFPIYGAARAAALVSEAALHAQHRAAGNACMCRSAPQALWMPCIPDCFQPHPDSTH